MLPLKYNVMLTLPCRRPPAARHSSDSLLSGIVELPGGQETIAYPLRYTDGREATVYEGNYTGVAFTNNIWTTAGPLYPP